MDRTDSKLVSEMGKLHEGDSEQHKSRRASLDNLESPDLHSALSEDVRNKICEVFNVFDTDNSGTIDKKEALKHWKGAFGKLSAKEFFSAVDVDNDGEITLEEFFRFWESVKKAGNSEESILEELENMKRGESWVGFENMQKGHGDSPLGSARHLKSEQASSRRETEQLAPDEEAQGEGHVKFNENNEVIAVLKLPYDMQAPEATSSEHEETKDQETPTSIQK